MSRPPRLFRSLGLLVIAALVLLQLRASAATPDADHDAASRGPRPLAERVQIGAFVEGMQADPSRFGDWEDAVGGRAGIASYYYGYGDVFPAETELRFSDVVTRKVLLSWDMGPTRFTEWSSGDHDDYLDRIAAAARAYPYEVYVRPWPEMNGDWQTSQPTADGERRHAGTYAEFRRAWRHVVSYLRDQGADNLRWVRSMFDYRGMPRLRAVVWFDADKERDWRVNSSNASARQWRRVMSGRPA